MEWQYWWVGSTLAQGLGVGFYSCVYCLGFVGKLYKKARLVPIMTRVEDIFRHSFKKISPDFGTK